MLIYVHSGIAIILMGKRELVALVNMSSWCLMMVERLFLVVPWGCLRFVIVVFLDHTHLLFLQSSCWRRDSWLYRTRRIQYVMKICLYTEVLHVRVIYLYSENSHFMAWQHRIHTCPTCLKEQRVLN